jgi:hypothetical protein
VSVRRTFLLPLLALLLAAPGALAAGGGGVADPHPAVAALEAAGIWRPLEPPRNFGPGNLFEEIDGEAELFLPYGMRRLTVAVAVRRGDPAGEVRMELYRMDSPRDAYGIWSQHRYPDQETLRLPSSEAVVSDTSADFFRGDTFVRLRAKPSGRSRKDVADLAAAVAGLLPGSGAPPEEARILAGLPGTVAGSVILQKRAALGYECLSPGFEASFSLPSASGHYLLLPPLPGGEDARQERLARDLPGYAAGSPSLSRAALPSGTLWISRTGNCVVAVAGKMSPERAEALLGTLAEDARGYCGRNR